MQWSFCTVHLCPLGNTGAAGLLLPSWLLVHLRLLLLFCFFLQKQPIQCMVWLKQQTPTPMP